MKSWMTFATSALALAVVFFSGAPAAAPQGQEGLSLPLRLSAFAVNMSTVNVSPSAKKDARYKMKLPAVAPQSRNLGADAALVSLLNAGW